MRFFTSLIVLATVALTAGAHGVTTRQVFVQGNGGCYNNNAAFVQGSYGGVQSFQSFQSYQRPSRVIIMGNGGYGNGAAFIQGGGYGVGVRSFGGVGVQSYEGFNGGFSETTIQRRGPLGFRRSSTTIRQFGGY